MRSMTVRRWLAAFAALLLIAVGVAACGGSDSGTTSEATTATGGTAASESSEAGGSAPAVEFSSFETKLPECYAKPKPGNYTIGWSSPLDANETLHVMARSMQLETEALGGKFILEDAAGDPDKQIATIQRLINDKVDAIIASPLDAHGLTPVLKQAESAGIPVIGVDVHTESGSVPPGYLSQVLEQRDRIAYLAAQAMSELVPANSELGQINFAVPVPSLEYYTERAKYWAEQFGMNPVAVSLNQQDDITGGEQAMTQLLSEAPDIAGVLSYNDESATGAHSVVRSQGKEIALVGQNGGDLAYSSIGSGAIQASVQIGIPGVGICAVWGAYDAVGGEKIPPTVRGLEGPKVLNASNIEEIPTWEEFLESRFGSNG